MANKVTWFEITGKDAAALRSFYGRLFDWQFRLFEEMDYGTIDAPEGGIGGGIGSAGESEAWITVYVETPDVTATLKTAESLGATVLMPETNVMEGVTIGLFRDPEGHVVGLLKGEG